MPYAPSRDTQIYYELHGPKPGAAAPAIVFAHGMGGNHLSWWQQVPHFRKRFTCLTFDHRGFGLSGEPPGGPGGAAFAHDLRALFDHAGIARASIVAQSMGGWTALAFALAQPERVDRLVMCDTVGGLLTPEIEAARNAAWANPPQLPPDVHPAAGVRMLEEQPVLHFLYREINALSDERPPQEMLAIIRAAGTVSPEEAASLPMPVLFIAGEEDIVIPPPVLELAVPHFRNARLVIVPRAGHSVYFERADAFNATVEEFLSA